MSSKLLKPGSEMYGKKKGDADQGLKAKWAGSDGSGTLIAPVGKRDPRRAAPLRDGKVLTRDMTGGTPQGRDGYGKV